MRLTGHAGCPATHACAAALVECGADWAFVPAGGTAPIPAAVAGPLPVVAEAEASTCGATAILLTLGERFPDGPLLPPVATADRADALRWMVWLANSVHPALTRMNARADGALAPDVAASLALGAADELAGLLDHLDRHLAEHDHLAAGRFTAADLALHMLTDPAWWPRDHAPTSRPHLTAHRERTAGRPSVSRAAAGTSTR